MVSSIFPMKNVGFGWFVISQKITLKNALNLGSPYVVQPPPPLALIKISWNFDDFCLVRHEVAKMSCFSDEETTYATG